MKVPATIAVCSRGPKILTSSESQAFWISILVFQAMIGSMLGLEIDLTSSRSCSAIMTDCSVLLDMVKENGKHYRMIEVAANAKIQDANLVLRQAKWISGSKKSCTRTVLPGLGRLCINDVLFQARETRTQHTVGYGPSEAWWLRDIWHRYFYVSILQPF